MIPQYISPVRALWLIDACGRCCGRARRTKSWRPPSWTLCPWAPQPTGSPCTRTNSLQGCFFSQRADRPCTGLREDCWVQVFDRTESFHQQRSRPSTGGGERFTAIRRLFVVRAHEVYFALHSCCWLARSLSRGWGTSSCCWLRGCQAGLKVSFFL